MDHRYVDNLIMVHYYHPPLYIKNLFKNNYLFKMLQIFLYFFHLLMKMFKILNILNHIYN